jgi:hypothetical protein
MKLNLTAQPALQRYNRPLYGNVGQFTLSLNVTVPYLSTVMPLVRVIGELKTHEQVAPALDQKYNLKELFQREIDRERVKHQLVDAYLRNPRKLKFFNSITVALLPRTLDGVIQSEFDDYPNNNPLIPHDSNDEFDAGFAPAERIIFGGVQLARTPSGIARLRWDQERVDAVAVDGQHRLMALQRWFDENKNKSLEDHERATGIPILFLMLDSRAGFSTGEQGGATAIKSVAREIFTDLNKNARQVDKATEIILDDRSLTALCVRKLVTDQTATDDPELMPLSLVRWRDPNHRFDQDYYLNSLMNLHLLLGDIFEIEAPSDPVDADRVKEFLNALNRTFGLPNNNNELIAGDATLLRYYEDRYLDESGEAVIPLNDVPTAFLDSAVEGFLARFRPWLLKVVREFVPYRRLYDYARENNLVCGVFAQYLSQPSGHKKELEKTLEQQFGPGWKDTVVNQHIRIFSNIKGNTPETEEWAFKSIFQKALVKLAKLIEYDNAGSKELFGSVDDLLTFFGNMYQKGCLKVRAKLPEHKYPLWTFIALNPISQNIKVTSKVEANILALLKIWYLGYRYALKQGKTISNGAPESESAISPESILSQLYRKSMVAEWPLYDDIERVEEIFLSRPDIILGKEMEDISEKEKAQAAKERLLAAFSYGWIGGSTKPDPETAELSI